MIAGALPVNTTTLSPGSGSVDIYNNLIQANLSNDDGGGIRFLMSGNYPMNVYNNFIVNNVSTHEGGGISINDAPNVRVYNNTIMKNLTTATAITSNGAAAPAGLSTSINSALLMACVTSANACNGQPRLPAGSPAFSNPLLFNNIFWDNRAGTRAGAGVTGLATTDADYWDIGVADGANLLAPTNSVLQQSATSHAYATSPTNSLSDPAVASPYDIGVTFNAWRNNPAFLGAIMIATDLPPNLMGNYHIPQSSPAFNLGAASKVLPAYQVSTGSNGSPRTAPGNDIDGDARPALGGFDAGADEVRATTANLGITKSDGQTNVQVGQQLTYTITVTNAGPDAVNGALVQDTLSAKLTAATWTCAPAQSCGTTSGSGNVSTTVSLLNGASATFTVTATVAPNATGSLVNTATVTAPAGTTDPSAANNSATDTDTIVVLADLAITVTDGQTLVSRGTQVRYTIVVSNVGTSTVTGATVNDNFPNTLSGTINWTCASTGGATCGGGAVGSGTVNRTVNMPASSTLTFTTTSGSVSTTTGSATLVNTATVTVPAGYQDTVPANNSATDSDAIPGYHIAALSGVGSITSATQWSASVTITVHDMNHNPVAGVAVSGNWLLAGAANCATPTNALGQCTVTRTGISRTSPLGAASIYTLSSLSLGPNGYQPSLNEVAAVVTVARP
jgi:uncharacterized repeat protein (TIGR01451 family)